MASASASRKTTWPGGYPNSQETVIVASSSTPRREALMKFRFPLRTTVGAGLWSLPVIAIACGGRSPLDTDIAAYDSPDASGLQGNSSGPGNSSGGEAGRTRSTDRRLGHEAQDGARFGQRPGKRRGNAGHSRAPGPGHRCRSARSVLYVRPGHVRHPGHGVRLFSDVRPGGLLRPDDVPRWHGNDRRRGARGAGSGVLAEVRNGRDREPGAHVRAALRLRVVRVALPGRPHFARRRGARRRGRWVDGVPGTLTRPLTTRFAATGKAEWVHAGSPFW